MLLPTLITILQIVFILSTISTIFFLIICLTINDKDAYAFYKFSLPFFLTSTIIFSYISFNGCNENYKVAACEAVIVDKWCVDGKIYVVRGVEAPTLFFEAEISKEDYHKIEFNKKYNINATAWLVRPNFHPVNKITSLSLIENKIEK